MPSSIRKRQVAYKVNIRDIVNSKLIKQEGFDPNYIKVNGNQVSRINIIATIIGKFISEDGNYGSITLEDGTETIRVKAFGPDVQIIKKTKIGSIIRFIGKVKEYEGEIYLAPEVSREIDDPNWIIVHKLEAGNPKSAIERQVALPEKLLIKIPENQSKETSKKPSQEISKEQMEEIKILELIKAQDTGDGADMKKVISESKLNEDEAQLIIVNLLKSGDIYEPKKGILKVLE